MSRSRPNPASNLAFLVIMSQFIIVSYALEHGGLAGIVSVAAAVAIVLLMVALIVKSWRLQKAEDSRARRGR